LRGSADVRATVVVPTHDHGPLVEYAVASALAQTERDLEVLIVGDGVPDAARPAIERVVASDPRVRFLDRPKGPGHGFRHRDEAIREARGDNILYLSDDDLWLADHAEVLCRALEEAEFVASFPLAANPGQAKLKVPHDLALPHWRKNLLAERPTISLSVVGHTRTLYLGLDTGWRRDDPDYKAVWREFALRTKRMATVPRLTAVVLPSTKRTEMSEEERVAELARVAQLVQDPAGRLQLLEGLFEHEVRRWARLMPKLDGLRAKKTWIKDRYASTAEAE
jgi:glycosyltransferase involved in cell wall biosynthesis